MYHVFGSPDEVYETLKLYQDVGLDQVVTTPGAGWHDPHDRVIESIQLVGEKVLPRLRS